MKVINYLNEHFNNYLELNDKFVGTPPYPMIVFDNFLPAETIADLEKECNSIPDQHWTEFTRRGSHMLECNNMAVAPVAFDLTNQLNSQLGMKWLTAVTGITDLIPDPYLIGAGYGKSYNGDSLKIHTDFNWNDKIKMHRMLSVIIYLNSNWKEQYGGALQFKDFENNKVIQEVSPLYNRAVIWRYHKKGFHGYPDPIQCPVDISRNTFRLFYYVSNADYDPKDRPHRSLYWFDKDLGEPYDIPTHK